MFTIQKPKKWSDKTVQSKLALPKILALVLTAALAGCDTVSFISSPLQERGVTGFFKDNVLRIRLNRALAGCKGLSHTEIMVHRGQVLLMGAVSDTRTKALAQTRAESVNGVTALFNAIEVAPAQSSYVHDAVLAEKMRSLLFFDTRISSQNYHVRVVNAILYILGTAQSEAEKQVVLRHGESLTVRKVMEYIQVIPPAYAGPASGKSTAPYHATMPQ